MQKRFLRFHELQSKIGLSRSTIWRLEREKQFPARHVLGKNSVAWLESEVDDWMHARARAESTEGSEPVQTKV